jgi:hypothetical protein
MAFPELGKSEMNPEGPEKDSREVGETKEETGESSEAIKRVEQATFEPEAVVEREGDYRQAEEIKDAFIKVVEAPVLQAASDQPPADGSRQGDRPADIRDLSGSLKASLETAKDGLVPDGKSRIGTVSDDSVGPSSLTDPALTKESEATQTISSVRSNPPDAVNNSITNLRGDSDSADNEARSSDDSLRGDSKVTAAGVLADPAGQKSVAEMQDSINNESQVASMVSGVMRMQSDTQNNIIENLRGDSDIPDDEARSSDRQDLQAGSAVTLEQVFVGGGHLETDTPLVDQGEAKGVTVGPVKTVSTPESGEETQTPVAGTAEQTEGLDTAAEEITAGEALAEVRETAAEYEKLAAAAEAAEAKAAEAVAAADAAAEAAAEAAAAAQEAWEKAGKLQLGAMVLSNPMDPPTEEEAARYREDMAEANEAAVQADADAAAKATESEEARDAANAALAESKDAAAAAEAAKAAYDAAMDKLNSLVGEEFAGKVLSGTGGGEETGESPIRLPGNHP